MKNVKLWVEIPEDIYKTIKKTPDERCDLVWLRIKYSIPVPRANDEDVLYSAYNNDVPAIIEAEKTKEQ